MKKNNIFWIGYSDLMTSLFFIMLVLFVMAIGYLQVKNIENERLIAELKKREIGLIKEKEKLEKLLNLEKQFEPLIEDSSFYYLPDCKKFIVKDLMGIEIFEPNQFAIKEQYIQPTIDAGNIIKDFLSKLNQENPELSYLLVIEGNMANTFDQRINKDDNFGYLTSYQRALSVYKLWLRNNINFRSYNVEVMLCGSGFNGLCRESREEDNKRFSIQIIPKVSK
ncbi:MAG: hypothetical protein RBQ97_12035 [Acholeplasma sp.]|jgi:hypothetical protein|nr:hypothetical protein [Acholeplasma sp.]